MQIVDMAFSLQCLWKSVQFFHVFDDELFKDSANYMNANVNENNV